MKAVIKPREAPARERRCTKPKAEEASWVERGLACARRSLPEAVMVARASERPMHRLTSSAATLNSDAFVVPIAKG